MTVIDVQAVAAEPDQWTSEERRIWRARKQRIDHPDKPTAIWAAKELAYYCVMDAPRFAYYVVVRMPLGMDAAACTAAGERNVRLLYDWNEHIVPHLHLTSARLSNDVLSQLALEGERLRAAVRYARAGRNMVGGAR